MKEREITDRIRDELMALWRTVPFVRSARLWTELPATGSGGDLVFDISTGVETFKLLVEVKAQGEPRFMRRAIAQLKGYVRDAGAAYGLVAAPYISGDVAAICREEGVGYVDLSGNRLLSFHQIYIESGGHPNPFVERRQARSLFCPKSSRIIRVMLSDPGRAWQVQQLWREAGVAAGLASRVKERLLDLEYARRVGRTVVLSRPAQLLRKWAAGYALEDGLMHGYRGCGAVARTERELARYCSGHGIPYALTLDSGLAAISPGRPCTRGYAYVGGDIPEVARRLGLRQAPGEPDFTLIEPYDAGVFYGSQERRGRRIVGAVQLYLDTVAIAGSECAAAGFIFGKVLSLPADASPPARPWPVACGGPVAPGVEE